MNERGYAAFTVVGVFLIILTAALIEHFSWDEHRVKMESADDMVESLLLSEAGSVQSALRQAARYSVYDALWKVSKNASGYRGREDRELAIERIASKNLNEFLSSLDPWNGSFGLDVRLEMGQESASVDISPWENGYVVALVSIPGCVIEANAPDNSLGFRLTYENFEIIIDSRYYLLEDLLEGFAGDLDSIEDKWKYAEYMAAYAEALVGRQVTLSKFKSQALFQLAWASQELSTFGSSDYLATALSLCEIGDVQQIPWGYSSVVVGNPLNTSHIGEVAKRVEDVLEELEGAERELAEVQSAVEDIVDLDLGDLRVKVDGGLEDILSFVEESNVERVRERFGELCEDFRLAYSTPLSRLEGVLSGLEGGKLHVQRAEENFRQVLELLEEIASDDSLMAQLYNNFTSGDGALAKQILRAFSGVERALDDIKFELCACEPGLHVPSEISSIFPGELEKRLASAEDNLSEIERILGDARERVHKAIEEFENFIGDAEDNFRPTFSRVSSELETLLERPEPNWFETYVEYPDPGKDPNADPVTKTVRGYLIEGGEPTIGGLKLVLEEVLTNLDRLEDLAEAFDSLQGDLTKWDIDGDLLDAMEQSFVLPSTFDREQAYELAPPEPIRSDPGISVFHEFEVADIRYEREDPVGRFAPSLPTPIYLWFIGTTIYWAQWNVTLELRDNPLEEIFDYENPTLVRPMPEDGDSPLRAAHKPLAYRCELPEKKFDFRLVVVSLSLFHVQHG
ncbi:MAG: hypothetical protein J7J17_04205 [Hadesarchaea archaeon]|nr:hypothetical protein [Hadesarchaea archaeon]